MDWPRARAGVVLGFTFGGCALPRIPRLRLDRPAIGLIGGLATVFLGVLAPPAAYDAIGQHLDVLALLLGMMIVAGGLAEAGVYARIARALEPAARRRPLG